MVGVGNISKQYLEQFPSLPDLRLTAVADLDTARAAVVADEQGVQALGVDELLASPDVDVVLNLTIPAAHADVALHWQITEAGDGVEVWGTATVHGDLETKRRLWTGVFDYDLDLFSPGGPDGSPNTVFVAVQPERALSIKAYGLGGRETWKAG